MDVVVGDLVYLPSMRSLYGN